LQSVFNRLQDLELVSGSSAEMWWRGAFPGLGFMSQKDTAWDKQTMAEIEQEVSAYIHGLQRYLRLEGMDVRELAPTVADPSKHVSILLDLISGATGIPKRILIGSERGELASSQDETAWNSRVDERRRNYAEPQILRPFIDRLVTVGALPQPQSGYVIEWPAIFTPSEKEQAEMAKTRAEALNAYMAAPGVDMILPPSMFLKHVMGFTDEQVEEASGLLESAFENDDDEE
jgi:hypothetical protein